MNVNNECVVDSLNPVGSIKAVVDKTVMFILRTDGEPDETYTKKLVENSADFLNGEISKESPIGKNIVGHCVGEIVKYNVDKTPFSVEILEIK